MFTGGGVFFEQAFMNDPRLLLWVTNQHQAIGAVHPKVNIPRMKGECALLHGLDKFLSLWGVGTSLHF
jgi:hypothetical protein